MARVCFDCHSEAMDLRKVAPCCPPIGISNQCSVLLSANYIEIGWLGLNYSEWSKVWTDKILILNQRKINFSSKLFNFKNVVGAKSSLISKSTFALAISHFFNNFSDNSIVFENFHLNLHFYTANFNRMAGYHRNCVPTSNAFLYTT